MRDSAADPACELLDWDSDFFDRRIARYTRNRMDKDTAARAVDWCISNEVACLYLLADSSDPGTARVAADFGFRFVDVRVTFSSDLVQSSDFQFARDLPVRFAEERDIAPLAALARVSHRATRFYFDNRFSEDRCDELYATWIEQSCRGFADAVFVAGVADAVNGYVTCHLSDAGTGSIGLLAVREGDRGRGYGRSLVAAALGYLRMHERRTAFVTTQGRNIASQRLYEACGFRVHAQQLWYHRWFI